MKVFFDMVGCRLNQAEIEKMAFEFRQNGHTIVSSLDEAETVIVNTCTVTNQAASDSRQKIRHAAQLKNREIIATGCWSTLDSQKAKQLGENVRVVPNLAKDHLVKDFLLAHGQVPVDIEHPFDLEPISREPIPGLRQRTRAFIKVQDGCDNLCTFCVTRIARGKGVSRSVSEVLNDIQIARQGGTQEIVLTGVHLGSWGNDFSPALHLTDLLVQILNNTDVPRIRLSSLEPWDLDRRFLELWENPRMMPHLHLPLQAGSDATLKRMLRKVTTSSYRELIKVAREIIPDVAITTDIIAGFPGETEHEFEQTLNFVKSIGFAGAHVFSYSEREGTAASRIQASIPHLVRKERNQAIQEVVRLSADRYHRSWLDREVSVLWESSIEQVSEGWKMIGLSENYIKVSVISTEPMWNTISRVRLKGQFNNIMIGEIVG